MPKVDFESRPAAHVLCSRCGGKVVGSALYVEIHDFEPDYNTVKNEYGAVDFCVCIKCLLKVILGGDKPTVVRAGE